jgi:hypothetical protein
MLPLALSVSNPEMTSRFDGGNRQSADGSSKLHFGEEPSAGLWFALAIASTSAFGMRS